MSNIGGFNSLGSMGSMDGTMSMIGEFINLFQKFLNMILDFITKIMNLQGGDDSAAEGEGEVKA